MTPEQQKRIEQRDEAERQRADLSQRIARGEKSLLATDDNRTRVSLNRELSAMRDELHRLNTILAQGFRESFGEFKQRMKCECIQLGLADGYPDGGRLVGRGSFLFQNGALSDGVTNHYEAPVEQATLLRLRKHFIATKLKREIAAFDQFKASCEQQAGYHLSSPMTCPPPPANAADQLRAGKARIEKLRDELAAIDRERATLPGLRANAAFIEQQRQRNSAAKEALAEIVGVQI